MTTTEKALAVASVVLLAFAGLVGEALGRSRAEGDALDRSLAMVRVEVARQTARADSLAKRYRADTVRLWRSVSHYDSVRVRDTLLVTRVDTVHHDTTRVVFVPRAAADSAVAACVMAVRTCESRVGAERARGDAYAEEARLALAEASNARSRGRWASVGAFVLGAAAGIVAQKVRP